MFDGFLKPKFYSKCKTAVKLTKIRLDTIIKKRSAIEKYLKNDIVDLLKSGLDYNAYGRAEGLLVEQNMSCCYHLVEQFVGRILSNLSVMQKERECPEECREAVPSLMFAAARFADLPELRELRSLFTEKYGTSMENFVNKEFAGRLKAGPPSKDVKLQLLRDIALESSLQWDSKALEQKLFTPQPTVQELPKHASPEETRDDSPRSNRRERRDFLPERETDVVRSKSLYEEPKQNERPSPYHHPKETGDIITFMHSDSSKKGEQEKEGRNHSSRPSYRDIPPPYIKANPEKEKIVVEENKAREDVPVQEAKPKPRSVRQRRSLKLPPGREAEQSHRAVQTIDNEVDEEERVVDGLLMHYTKKQSFSSSPNNGLKGSLKPLQESNLSSDSNHSRRQKGGKPEFGALPNRASSFPAEALSPAELNETAKGCFRANSLENNMFHGHVHPNLPDYDDLASKIAAIRGR